MAPPHFQGSVGGSKSSAQRTSLMLPKKPSLLPVRVGPPKDRLLASSFKEYKLEGRARRRRGLLQGLQHQAPPGASRGLQRPGASRASTALQWLEAGLCLPMYGRSPEGLYTSVLHSSSHCLTQEGVKADVFLQCLTTLVMGGNVLCRPGGNLGFKD